MLKSLGLHKYLIYVLFAPLYSPHPVKPLTNTAMQGEKKPESRSVLEKLKSTINPGKTAPPTTAEDETNQVLKVSWSKGAVDKVLI